jgi:hypothetical protein
VLCESEQVSRALCDIQLLRGTISTAHEATPSQGIREMPQSTRTHIVIADEYHVLFHCSAYKDIQNMYIAREVTSVSNIHNFVAIMNNNNTQDVNNLAHFHSLFKTRKKLTC